MTAKTSTICLIFRIHEPFLIVILELNKTLCQSEVTPIHIDSLNRSHKILIFSLPFEWYGNPKMFENWLS